jgi:superfamily I DNA/RNA helicase
MPYYFNLPVFTDLTTDQRRAINEVHSLALAGGPGTGKSVVCLWRHVRNYATGTKKSILITYTKTLEHYLKQSAILEDVSAGNNIGRVFWWLSHDATNYDEIIIDEGQDIKKNVFERFKRYSDNISFGADERQSLYLKNDELKELSDWLGSDSTFLKNVKITLNRNFRNSKEILLFTRSVFPNFLIPQNTINRSKETGLKPIMKLNIGWDIDSQVKEIISIINDFQSDTENIAILVPFAGNVDDYYSKINEIIDNKIEISSFQNEHDNFSGLSGVHITTFKSAKGTEFDTVIIPEFDKYTWIMQHNNITSENDYYVAFTRAKANLFLICRNGFPNIGSQDTVTIE